MMQSGRRGESSLQAGILLYRSRLEIATRIKIKLSPWGALSTAEERCQPGRYQWYSTRMKSLGKGTKTFYVSAVPRLSQIHHQ